MALQLETFLCEGALRHLRAVGPNHAQLYTSVENETEQKTRQQNIKTRENKLSIKTSVS